MRLISKYFWLQRRKSKREMAKSFYKQFDIPVNKKCLVALFPNTIEIQIRAGILGFLHYSAPVPSTARGPRSILMVLGSEVEGGRAWIVFRDLRVFFLLQTKRETTWPQICLSGWETHRSKERNFTWKLGPYASPYSSFGCFSFMSTKFRKSGWIPPAAQNVHAPVASAQTISAA